jgi:hypothetical protein
MKQFLYSSTGNNLLKGIIPGLLFFLFVSLSNGLKAQVYSANFNSNIQSWVNGSSNSWSRVSTGGVSNSGCLTSTIVCEDGQQQGSCINQNNYFIATPSVSLTGGNTYQISVKCSVATASTRKLVLGVNTSQARSGATTLQNFGYVSTDGYTAFTVNYTPTSSGSPYFVLWGEKNLTQTVGLWLDDFAVTLVNSAPTISLTSPANNSVYNEGASAFTFQASVSDAESNLSKVEFYSNGTKVGEKTSSPYSISYIPTVGGYYSLTAKATDSYGANTTSAARTISFRTMPIIEFVTPDLEFPTYAEGPLSLTVNATDADGTVSYVDFYLDGDLVYTDMASPWSYSWSATAGTHEFNAVATDNHGLQSDQNAFPAGFGIETNTCSLSAPTSSSNTICEGASLTFTSGYSSLLTGTIQWQRQPSGGSWANISGATSASYSATLSGNYRGIWTFENGAMCTTTSKTLVVAPNPTVTVAPVTVYGNEPALAVAVASGGTAPYTYSWSTGSCEGYSPCDSVMISNFNSPVTVSVEDGNGCLVVTNVVQISLYNNDDFLTGNILGNLTDAEFGSKLNATETLFQEFINESKSNSSSNAGRTLQSTDVVFIPVVVAVCGPVATVQNDASVENIEFMFSKINAFYKNHPFIGSDGKNKVIKLCFAGTDIQGQTIPHPIYSKFDSPALNTVLFGSTGPLSSSYYPIINQIFPNFTNSTNPRFPYQNYLRMYIGTLQAYNPTTQTGTSAFSFYPSRHALFSGHPTDDPIHYDGVYVDYRIVNGTSTGANIVAHEIGHWFDVYHPFDHLGTSTFCSSVVAEANHDYYKLNPITNKYEPTWDFVKDTRPLTNKWDVQSPTVACSSVASGPTFCDPIPDPNNELLLQTKLNIMDYGSKQCTGLLSQGQIERMYYALNFYRPALTTIENAINTGVICLDQEPVSSFSVSKTNICGTLNEVTATRFPIPAGWTGKWISSGGGVSEPTLTGNNATFTISTSTSRVVTLTWKLTKSDLTVTKENSIEILVSENCIGSGNYKSNVFFGQNAGISFVANESLATPNSTAASNSILNDRLDQTGSLATFSDANGNLKFYAGGVNLWNAAGTKVTSGLQSISTYSQFGLALPDPDGGTIYGYLITVSSNHGIRCHKIHLANINTSSPSLSLTSLNLEATNPTTDSPPLTTASPQSIRTTNKITACKIPNEAAYWIISQGAVGTSWQGRLLFFKLTSSGLAYHHFQEAGKFMAYGILAVSPDGKYLVNTFTNLSNTGYGESPENAVIYNLYPQEGKIYLTRELTVTGVTGNASAFGASFDATSKYLYTFVNLAPTLSGSTETRYAGIYSYDLDPCNSLEGQLVSLKPFGTSPTNSLMLGADKKIYISKDVDPKLQDYLTSMNLTTSPPHLLIAKNGKDLGVIHFPSAPTEKGVDWEAIPLPDPMKSYGGLGNFIDAMSVQPLAFQGNDIDHPVQLGTNPGSCCLAPVQNLSVSCAGNEHLPLSTGNEVYFSFILRRFCTHYNSSDECTNYEFTLPLRVDVSGTTDFAVTPVLAYKNAISSTLQTPSNFNFSGNVLNLSSSDLNDLNPNSLNVEFLLRVEALSNLASGQFIVKVNYRDFDVAGNNPSCCRIAIENAIKEDQSDQEKIIYPTFLNAFPNPAQTSLTIQTNKTWQSYKIMDTQGRILETGGAFEKELQLQTSSFPNGLYRMVLFGDSESKTVSFQIIK